MFGDIIFRLLKIKEITQHQVKPIFYNQITNLIYEIVVKLENTKCKNCKYWKRYENQTFGKCNNEKVLREYVEVKGTDIWSYCFEPDENFCCNKFERK